MNMVLIRRLVLSVPLLAAICLAMASPASSMAADDTKKVVFIAGGPSHDYGSHEHYAGCRLLADTIHKQAPHVRCEIVQNGWPADESIFEGVHAIVIYSDGGGGHPANQHLDRMQALMDQGVGLVCLHYGVEVPKGPIGDKFLEWLGGYFETHWSVNPHWKADFPKLPSHPITQGVKPFQAQDEWYFHMRFRPEMAGVTPILSAIAPASTMDRPDGPHSGNPDVRRAVAKGELQHVAWAYERNNGGRSFGFTGGHFHWNWGRPEICTLVSNAIVWSTGSEVPGKGVLAEPLSVQKLQENQDEPVPGNFSVEATKQTFELTAAPTAANTPTKPSRQLAKTPVVSTATPGHRMHLEVDIKGVKKLFLVVSDAGDGFSCDWADWIQPTLSNKTQTKKLTELNWRNATTQWGQVRKGRNVNGGPLSVQGQSIDDGIGTHANSVIEYDLPDGFEKLTVDGGLDTGGSSQNNGAVSSVQFALYAESLPKDVLVRADDAGQRDPSEAVSGLDVHSELTVTLAASEPTLKSLTNLDIDARGRVWVCEVVNYRRHSGERPEGDRILILEDTNGDGVMDTSKVFYQGKDIDSALGLCVLGKRVLVSAAPYVLEFTDEDGDDRPDKKVQIFTKTGQPQHDHSNHSFVFGPDGKLYWNFGNTGHGIYDAQGQAVLDRLGRPINDSGQPYRQGMAFRCNLDFTDMEVLGHNFRNNYELAVDSFGSVWQSDNDDDGNKATRINFVMEHGNFGYVDEITGEGWQTERTGWEPEIPRRHWHLNDPGVVPNMLITGAGSPTGILHYEGRLLPKVFWDQIIHCDAGPNVVRAYPAEADGAGYRAESLNLAVGTRDKWFRPADVCTAPDGSLYVTDWYDPGVGGHNMEDMERGRLFRIAPPQHGYRPPKIDTTTAEGAIAALTNPCQSVRFEGWQALQKMGEKAEPALTKLLQDPNPRMQARAVWLLGALANGDKVLAFCSKNSHPDLRITGIRLARKLQRAPQEFAELFATEKEPSVLRELAIWLRTDTSKEMPTRWVSLAKKYDGKDRWYLESLGIGAANRWSECIEQWLASTGKEWQSPASRELLWRARCSLASKKLVSLLMESTQTPELVDHYLRGLEFQNKNDREAAWQSLLQKAMENDEERFDRLIVEAAMRLAEPTKDPRLQARATRYVKQLKEDPSQLKIMRRLQLGGMSGRLIDLAATWGPSTHGVQAVSLALQQGGKDLILQTMLAQPVTERAKSMARTLALADGAEVIAALELALTTPDADTQIKIEASQGLARTPDGQRRLLELAKAQKLPGEAKVLVGASLRQAKDESIRVAALELFPEWKAAKSSLAPVSELVKRRGDSQKGKALFAGTATCAQCHIVQREGKNVGPDLSEIGSKLSKEAMYVSILDPNAGISHNYEAYMALQESGEVVTGLLISQNEKTIVLRDAKGIDRELERADLEKFQKSDVSLMPSNLEQALTEEGLVDLVEYLMSLQKR